MTAPIAAAASHENNPSWAVPPGEGHPGLSCWTALRSITEAAITILQNMQEPNTENQAQITPNGATAAFQHVAYWIEQAPSETSISLEEFPILSACTAWDELQGAPESDATKKLAIYSAFLGTFPPPITQNG